MAGGCSQFCKANAISRTTTPDYRIGKSEVLMDIRRARTAIDRFLAAPANVRRDFAIHVLTKMRADA